ncbi:MAG: hypothetical protein ABIZ56_01320 [Chthoniobacteraceae bacterium]
MPSADPKSRKPGPAIPPVDAVPLPTMSTAPLRTFSAMTAPVPCPGDKNAT